VAAWITELERIVGHFACPLTSVSDQSAICAQAGLTSAIMDSRTAQIVTAVKGADLMRGNDEWGANWIAAHRAKQAAEAAAQA